VRLQHFLAYAFVYSGFFKPALVAKAGLMTSAVVASLSAVVAVSPTKTFLKWEGALAAGFGALAAVSLGMQCHTSKRVIRQMAFRHSEYQLTFWLL